MIDVLTAIFKSAAMGGARPKAGALGKPGTPQKKVQGAPPNNPDNSPHMY